MRNISKVSFSLQQLIFLYVFIGISSYIAHKNGLFNSMSLSLLKANRQNLFLKIHKHWAFVEGLLKRSETQRIKTNILS